MEQRNVHGGTWQPLPRSLERYAQTDGSLNTLLWVILGGFGTTLTQTASRFGYLTI
jgi:hypothetical protein